MALTEIYNCDVLAMTNTPSGYSWGIPSPDDNIKIEDVLAMYATQEAALRDIGQWIGYVDRMGEKLKAQIDDRTDKLDWFEEFVAIENSLNNELRRVDKNPDKAEYKEHLERMKARLKKPDRGNYYLMTHHDKPISGLIISLDDKEIWGDTKNIAFLKSFVSIQPRAGKNLLRNVEHKLAFWGFESLNLDFWGENKALGEYYERNGFEPKGTAGEYKAGGTIAKMSKDLTKLKIYRDRSTVTSNYDLRGPLPGMYLKPDTDVDFGVNP
ncbi:MAG: hypothetical protein FWC00_02720 [Firmicutes bacterium]|nr:hypothetical protein [Bacillota bacterium]